MIITVRGTFITSANKDCVLLEQIFSTNPDDTIVAVFEFPRYTIHFGRDISFLTFNSECYNNKRNHGSKISSFRQMFCTAINFSNNY